MDRKLISRYRKGILLFSSLILLTGLLTPNFTVTAEDSPSGSGLLVTRPSDQEVKPEEVATYIFRLENQTTEPLTLNVRAVSAQGWPLLGPAEELTLLPGGEEYLVCSLLIPASVQAGTVDQLSLSLSGDNFEAEYTVTATVQAVRHLAWEPLPLIRAEAGTEIFLQVRLANRGTTTEQLDLEIHSEKGWPVYWHNPTVGPLLPGQTKDLYLSCLVPPATPAGTLDEVSLRLLNGGSETSTLTVKILTTEAQNVLYDQDLFIPFSSTVNFSYLPPTPQANMPWSLVWRSRGELFTDTRVDFFFSGTHDALAPTTTYLGLTGNKWVLRLGAVGHNWDGLIPPPTYSSSLYFQDQRTLPWSLWVGPTTAEATPLWWGTQVVLPRTNLRLAYLHNLEEERHFEHAFSGRYELYASPLYGWKLTTTGAVGLGATDSLTQGGIGLARREEDWEAMGEYHTGTDFYTLTAFDEFALSTYIYTPQDLRLATGYTWRAEDQPTSPVLHSNKLWTELATGAYRFGLAHTNRSDGKVNEIKAGTTRRHAHNTLSLSAAYIHEDLRVLSQSLLLSGRYRYRLTPENYLEALVNETLTYQQSTVTSQPELGVRWRYAPVRNPWNCFGLIQWDLSEPFSKINYFQTGFGAQTATGNSWQVYAQLFFQENAPIYSMTFRLQHHDRFSIPTPWSGMHGIAFIDLDRNGMYSTNEPVLAGLPIILNGSKETVTAADGRWEIPFTGSGQQVLEFPAEFEGYYTLQTRKEIRTVTQKSVSVLVPYLPPTEVYGRVFVDTNQNNQLDPGEEGLAPVVLAVFDHNNRLVIEKSADQVGAFYLTLLPGEYRLEVNGHLRNGAYEWPQPLTFKVTPESPLHLSVPVRTVPREIEFFHEESLPTEFGEPYTDDNW